MIDMRYKVNKFSDMYRKTRGWGENGHPFSDREMGFLTELRQTNIIKPEDQDTAYRLASLGYVSLDGYDNGDPDNFLEIGSLTPFGKECYRRTKINNSLVRSFFHALAASL